MKIHIKSLIHLLSAMAIGSVISCDQKEKGKSYFFKEFTNLSDSIVVDSIENIGHGTPILKLKWRSSRYGSPAYTLNNNWITLSNQKIVYSSNKEFISSKALFDLSPGSPQLVESFFDNQIGDTIFRLLLPENNRYTIADSFNIVFLISLKKGILGVYISDQTDYIKKYYGQPIIHSIIGNPYLNKSDYKHYFIVRKDSEWPSEIIQKE